MNFARALKKYPNRMYHFVESKPGFVKNNVI